MYIKSIFLSLVVLSFIRFSVSVEHLISEHHHPTIEKKFQDARNKIKLFLDKLKFSVWNKLTGYLRKWGLSTKNAPNITAVAEFVKDTIKSKQIVIFSKTYCPYCKMAKEVFDKLNQTYEAVEIDKREDAAAIQEVLEEITGTKTVPRVFLDGTCIGGGTDVKALYENGKLEQMLQKA